MLFRSNHLVTGLVFLCKRSIRILSRLVKTSYFKHLLPSQRIITYAFSTSCHVSMIINRHSDIQMRRIAALGIIAVRTIVQYMHSIWDWTAIKNPTCAVSGNGAGHFSVFGYLSIPTIFGYGCCPQPATGFGLQNLSDKPIWKVIRKPLGFKVFGVRVHLFTIHDPYSNSNRQTN